MYQPRMPMVCPDKKSGTLHLGEVYNLREYFSGYTSGEHFEEVSARDTPENRAWAKEHPEITPRYIFIPQKEFDAHQERIHDAEFELRVAVARQAEKERKEMEETRKIVMALRHQREGRFVPLILKDEH